MTQQGEQSLIRYRGFCFKERNHGSGIGIIDLASNSKEQPLLLGRYSLTLSTPLGIDSLDTVNSTGEHALLRRGFVNRLGVRIHDLASGSCDL